jgi:hypothetical protein
VTDTLHDNKLTYTGGQVGDDPLSLGARVSPVGVGIALDHCRRDDPDGTLVNQRPAQPYQLVGDDGLRSVWIAPVLSSEAVAVSGGSGASVSAQVQAQIGCGVESAAPGNLVDGEGSVEDAEGVADMAGEIVDA